MFFTLYSSNLFIIVEFNDELFWFGSLQQVWLNERNLLLNEIGYLNENEIFKTNIAITYFEAFEFL
jgi:hypothetical protein